MKGLTRPGSPDCGPSLEEPVNKTVLGFFGSPKRASKDWVYGTQQLPPGLLLLLITKACITIYTKTRGIRVVQMGCCRTYHQQFGSIERCFPSLEERALSKEMSSWVGKVLAGEQRALRFQEVRIALNGQPSTPTKSQAFVPQSSLSSSREAAPGLRCRRHWVLGPLDRLTLQASTALQFQVQGLWQAFRTK